ncbi:MAG: serine protease [Bacteriovoracaceae bacterium]|nr:serine protease [Bacteriovoracaceae bacterium]
MSHFSYSQEPIHAATIYGKDDREEVSTVNLTELSQGTVVALRAQFSWQLPSVAAPSVSYRFKVCSSDRFAEQPSIGSCTGIHLGDGVVLTAAHCVKNALDCESYKWAFNYRSDVVGETSGILKIPDAYSCDKILVTDETKDITLLRLTHSARSLPGTKVKFTNPVTNKVFAIGSPLGMPLKFSGMGDVTKVDDSLAEANLDTFHGNSGSPVFNENQQLIGLLLSGGDDFKMNSQGCRESLVVSEKKHDEQFLILNSLPAPFKNYIRRAQRKL